MFIIIVFLNIRMCRGSEPRLLSDGIGHVDDSSGTGVFGGGGSGSSRGGGIAGPRTGSGGGSPARPRAPRGRLGRSSGAPSAATRTFLSPVTRAAAQSAAAATTATVALTRGRGVGQCLVASYDS